MTTEGEIPTKFWARAFTRELEFHPTMAGYGEFLSLIDGRDRFQPMNFGEISPGGIVPRVAFIDPSRNWTIQLASESLDIHCSPILDRPPNFVEFCEEAADHFGRILRAKDAKAHRLAVLCDRILPNSGSEKQKAAPAKFLKLSTVFQDNDLFEWDWRAAVRVGRTFGNTTEPTNTLATLKGLEVKIQGEPSDRLWLQTDINTDPRKIPARFTGVEAEAFVRASPQWHSELSAAVVAQLEQES